jgi:hypothetical protein
VARLDPLAHDMATDWLPRAAAHQRVRLRGDRDLVVQAGLQRRVLVRRALPQGIFGWNIAAPSPLTIVGLLLLRPLRN